MKASLDRKILAGFAACTVVLVALAIVTFRNSSQFIETSQLVNHTHEVRFELEQVLVNIVTAQSNARGFVITGDDSYKEPYARAKTTVFTHITQARLLTKVPEMVKILDELEQLIRKELEVKDRCIQLRETDGFEAAQALISAGTGKQLQESIRNLIERSEKIEQDLLTEREQTSASDAKDFSLMFISLLVIITITLVIVYFVVTNNLTALRKAEKESSDQNWILRGRTDLVKDIQGNKSTDQLAEAIIHNVATYINAQIGALYIMDETMRELTLVAAYSLGKSPGRRIVGVGSGLVGQAAVDRKISVLSDVPAEDFVIDTGFGTIPPKTIAAVPLVFEGNVVGVIQLGSLTSFTDLKRQYLEHVVDSIAISIVSSQGRDKMRELLEETQRQSEELEVQQEELKHANEELQTRTESLQHSESELKTQHEILQQANVDLEDKATLLEQQREQLKRANAEIETTSRYKSEFLANMSHELRTPLNSILILSQLLFEGKEKKLGKKEIEYAQTIYNSGTDLFNLINDILDLSKVEAGKLQLEISSVKMREVTARLSATFSEVAKKKNINYEAELWSDCPDITSDQGRIEQILRNLLSNAFKFTESNGDVTLLISDGSNFRPGFIAFTVRDTGVGVPKEKQDVIFEAFQQADGSTKRKYGGTGLGLSISRELARALGGDIVLASEENVGSTFTLYLPREFNQSDALLTDTRVEVTHSIQSEKLSTTTNSDFSSELPFADDRQDIHEGDRVILILEDDETFAQILLDAVRHRKYKGIVARQGSQGLSYARHFRPEAILLDLGLPVVSGTEVLKQLKNDPDLKHIPVQIISAHDHKREGMRLGAFDYLLKPVSTADLQTALDRVESFSNRKLKKLLIVEDDRSQSKAIYDLIGNGDVKSYQAYTGSEAFALLGKESFDCIILDLGLPDMSGIDLLEKIKSTQNLERLPVIVYTAKDLNKNENLILNRFADAVILKTGNSRERLLDETVLFLHRMESQLPKEKQALVRKLHRSDEVLRDKTVLLVDDDIRNIYALANALEAEGIRCVTAENGKVALATLNSTPGIDLVLMDIMMPEMDGFEATTEIRKADQFKRLPIIALTAKAMKGDKEKCLAVGMSDYISKPVNIDQLLSLMRVWLYE